MCLPQDLLKPFQHLESSSTLKHSTIRTYWTSITWMSELVATNLNKNGSFRPKKRALDTSPTYVLMILAVKYQTSMSGLHQVQVTHVSLIQSDTCPERQLNSSLVHRVPLLILWRNISSRDTPKLPSCNYVYPSSAEKWTSLCWHSQLCNRTEPHLNPKTSADTSASEHPTIHRVTTTKTQTWSTIWSRLAKLTMPWYHSISKRMRLLWSSLEAMIKLL